METSLVSYTVVITAALFNTTVFRQTWLERIGVLAPDSLLPGTVFADLAVMVNTARFQMSVVPQQLVLAPQGEAEAGALVHDVVAKIVRALPETPYTAAGINFAWHLKQGPERIEDVTRRLFASDRSPLAHDFEAADARFGAYMSKDVGGGVRLKLDMKPIRASASGTTVLEATMLMFNFHLDCQVKPNGAEAIVGLTERWASFHEMASRLTRKLAEDGAGAS
jgi:hypothetical protein